MIFKLWKEQVAKIANTNDELECGETMIDDSIYEKLFEILDLLRLDMQSSVYPMMSYCLAVLYVF